MSHFENPTTLFNLNFQLFSVASVLFTFSESFQFVSAVNISGEDKINQNEWILLFCDSWPQRQSNLRARVSEFQGSKGELRGEMLKS